MLSKIVIRNVGVLKAFDTPNSPRLDKLTLIYGRNGRGKSTLTSVLRAARDGEAGTVLGRQSLGNGGAAPKVALTSSTGSIIFDNGKWNAKSAPIEVFDTAFITDNVYAGELIDLTHDRGLFSVIIGSDGVRLARHLDRFNILARTCAAALKVAETALANDLPSDLSKDEFAALGRNPDYGKRLDAAQRTLRSVQQGDKIAALKGLETLQIPLLPDDLAAVLASTVVNIDTSARERLLRHFKRFAFDRKGEAWLSYGMDHIHDDACPFCGRDEVDAESMITLYSQIFGETYKTHLANITSAAASLDIGWGEDARTLIARGIAANGEAAAKWAEYVPLPVELPDVSKLSEHIADAHQGAKALLDKKRSSPLDVVEATEELAAIGQSCAEIGKFVDQYNAAVEMINETTKKVAAGTAISESAAMLACNDAKKRMARHDPGVQLRVAAYYRAHRRDDRARKIRNKVQKALKSANEGAAEHYHQRVNHYLARFGASFTISKITNSMQGNAGQADYGLRIKGESVARGRGRQADSIPTFRNTLSAGDKTTLALAFFLAKLDQDVGLVRKTVVIDDPLSSHDSHRRRETVNAIRDLCTQCMQVLVLSHDEFLLRDVERRCAGTPCTALQIDFSDGDKWSSVSPADLEQICRAEHVRLVEEIIAFSDNRTGDPNHIVHNIRRVLETHYRRSYMAYFARNRNLGEIVRDIAVAGPSHPCYRDLSRLDNCNDATCDKHHGEDAFVVVKQGVNADELQIIASDALELIGAKRPVWAG